MGVTDIQRGYIFLYGTKSTHGTNDFLLVAALTQILRECGVVQEARAVDELDEIRLCGPGLL